MSEFGGEIFVPGEGEGSAGEQISEEAKQRFAASAAAMKQIRREEKKHKKRDDQVARTIIHFLDDAKYAYLFVLISRLVARDCPSIFILAILSLIDDECRKVVEDYLSEEEHKTAREMVEENTALMKSGALDVDTNRALVEWITRMQMVLSREPDKILLKIMVDDRNIDGTILQLTTFVLQELFVAGNRKTPFDQLQSFTAGILQTVFEPFIDSVRKLLAEKVKEKEEDEE